MSTSKDIKDTGQTLANGSLFYGSFEDFGDIWFAVTFWNTIGCGIVYLGCGIVAAVISKRFKIAAFLPLITTLYGLVVGISAGAIAALTIAAMYSTGPFQMQWEIAAVWGLGLALFHFFTSIFRAVLR